MVSSPHQVLAALLDYPGPELEAGLRAWPEALAGASPVVRGLVEEFAQAAAATPQARLEEIYTHCFDLTPEYTLNLGHHLFGDDWKRSALLIELKALFQRHGVDTGGELPDHLCWLLRLRAATPANAETRELVASCLLPALRRLTAALPTEGNPYPGLLQALELVLRGEAEG